MRVSRQLAKTACRVTLGVGLFIEEKNFSGGLEPCAAGTELQAEKE